MAKNKKKASTPRTKAKVKARAQTNNSPSAGRFDPSLLFDGDEYNTHFRGFSGASARAKPGAAMPAPSVKLRHQAISFVSATGSNTPVEEPPETLTDSQFQDDTIIDSLTIKEPTEPAVEPNSVAQLPSHLFTTPRQPEEQGVQGMDMDIEAPQKDTVMHSPLPDGEREGTAETPLDALQFVIDTTGNPSLASKAATTTRKPIPRPSSPAESTSSEEGVVFQGRGNVATQSSRAASRASQTKPAPPSASTLPSIINQPPVTGRLPRNVSELPSAPPIPTPASMAGLQNGGWVTRRGLRDLEAEAGKVQPWVPAPEGSWWKNRRHPKEPNVDLGWAGEDKIPAPTPSNSRQTPQETFDTGITSPQVDGQLGADEFISLSSTAKGGRRSKNARKRANRAMKAAMSSDDDDEAGIRDYMENLAENQEDIEDFMKMSSAALGGPSMVVNGQEIGDDDILKHQPESEIEDDDQDDLDDDDSEDEDIEDGDEDNSIMDSSEFEEELEYNEQQQWDDEEDLRQRRIERMEDEQLARLLQKQEELGIDGPDLMIDDGLGMDTEYGFGDVNAARAGLDDLGQYSFTYSKAPNKKRGKGDSFPSASALADTLDQYGDTGFDIMDFDRPSVRPKKKGKKGKMPLELELLSDSDERERLHDAWENDRLKKSMKKAEREELRSQGLLGSAGRNGRADLGQRYSNGMTDKQILEEIRLFLASDFETRAFPPMDKKDRKALHQLSASLGLKSKSQDSGKKRHTVLIKTNRTLEYDADMFAHALDSFNGRPLYLKNMSKRGKPNKFKGEPAMRPNRKARGGISDVSLRNGEVVGAGAQEIGESNFGHRMLQKMGWTKGQALGKDGEGLLVPVEQKMRTGKAGLG